MSTTKNSFTLLVRKGDSTLRLMSPVHIVYKGNAELRICEDLREANNTVIRERFPISQIQDLLCQLSGAKMFSKLDVRKTYWQIRLSEGS